MKKFPLNQKVGVGLAAVMALAGAVPAVAQTPIAHWSFDTPTLSLDGGTGNILGAADSTGNHNMTVGSGVGSASVANGGPTFMSNPIPGGNSVSGQFGQALTLSGFNNFAGGGGQFMMFPELTELMGAGGAASYTVSMWVNTTATSFQRFAMLSDWGNSATTPGRFAYGFGPNAASQLGAQARFDSGTSGGSDIFARAGSATATPTPLNDGAWHMLTWTFDKSSRTISSYFDAELVEAFVVPDTISVGGTDIPLSVDMVMASSAFGTLGFKGDSGNFINGSFTFDDIWILNGAADSDGIDSLFAIGVIPEPSSFALISLGALAFGMFRRRR